jgi:putative phosphoesterase
MMRLAVVSDIHGNLPALEAVLADLEKTHPDAVVLGGDLALGGPHPIEVVDRLRELGWPSVRGNTDEALDESRLPENARSGFLAQAAARTREMVGPERAAWLIGLPLEWRGDGTVVMHATPGDCWSIVLHDAPDEKLQEVYGALGVPTSVYGHIHHAYVRRLDGLTVANTGSVSLSLDGDTRACYAIFEDGDIRHRRIEYDIESVAADYEKIGYPNAAEYARWLRTGVT